MRGRWLQNGVLLAAAAGAATLVAAASGRPGWAAAVGGGLAVACWALEWASWSGFVRQAGFATAVGVAVLGAGLRVAVALAGLTIVGVLARHALPTAAVAFLGGLTALTVLRIARPVAKASSHAGGAP